MKKYSLTIWLAATRAFDGGLFYILSDYLLKLAQVTILLLLWTSLAEQGADLGGFTLQQLLSYSLLSSVLREQLSIVTPATTAFWEGSIISRYLRPAPVLAQLVAETIGSWLPGLLLYSAPVLMGSALFGIVAPSAFIVSGPLFVFSLLLSISLGFALDFLFAAALLYMKNASYQAYSIRQAVTRVFSGAVIPFALFPWGIGAFLQLLPFGSIASAPLLIFTGSTQTLQLLLLQLLWNVILWPLAIAAFGKSQERMVSYGG